MRFLLKEERSKPKYDIKFDGFKELPNGALMFPIFNSNEPALAKIMGYGVIPPNAGNSESIIGHFTEFNEEEEKYLLKQLHDFRLAMI